MFECVDTLLDFNNSTKCEFPYHTKTFWIHQELIDEIVAWAEATEINGLYLAAIINSGFRRKDITCAFAFKTEAELGIFNLGFFSKIIEDQRTTQIYKLTILIEQFETATQPEK